MAAPDYPGTRGGERYRVLGTRACRGVAKVVTADPAGQFVIGARVVAWAHVELRDERGACREEVLPMTDGPKGWAVVDGAEYAGVWGDVGDMTRVPDRTPPRDCGPG